jgi:hypothetical protein
MSRSDSPSCFYVSNFSLEYFWFIAHVSEEEGIEFPLNLLHLFCNKDEFLCCNWIRLYSYCKEMVVKSRTETIGTQYKISKELYQLRQFFRVHEVYFNIIYQDLEEFCIRRNFKSENGRTYRLRILCFKLRYSFPFFFHSLVCRSKRCRWTIYFLLEFYAS